jgi:hypothetical protein
MKPRVIAPLKILAVALGTVSCGKTTSEDRPATPPAQAADEKPAPQLVLLRAELDRETRESALAKQAHYRPLCDKDGYPLVGNVNRKGPGGPQPSELCADIRAKKAPPS